MKVHKNLLDEALRRARAMLAGAADAGWQDAPTVEVTWKYHGRGMDESDTCPAIITTPAGITAVSLTVDEVIGENAANSRDEPEEGTVISWWDLLPLMRWQDLDERTVYYFPGLEIDE